MYSERVWHSIGLYGGHEWVMVLNLAGSRASPV